MKPDSWKIVTGLALLCGATPAARASDPVERFWSAESDVVIRRTDSCNCGPMAPGQALPDLLGITLAAWQPTSPGTDLYTGTAVACTASACTARFVRIELAFRGLVCPPGTLGIGSGTAVNPFQFGPSPVYGFVDFDIDRDTDTGGDLPSIAPTRFLANAARFGVRPYRNGSRAAVTGDDLYNPWNVDPQITRSGADFTLVMCGCSPVTVVSKSDPGAAAFGIGATWVVQGRFFQRASGYQPASFATGGSTIGAYDPIVRLRFQHSVAENITTVTLVFPLDQIGAQQMAALATTPSINTSVSDAASVQEAVSDLIARAQQTGGMPAPTRQLIQRWANKTFDQVRDPTRWIPTAIVGTTYSQPTDSPYVWTDIGPEVLKGDVDGDGEYDDEDGAAVAAAIAAYDGQPGFDTGGVDGRVVVPGFGANFNRFDRNGDGVIDGKDEEEKAAGLACPGDFDRNGLRTIDDIFVFLNTWFAGGASADVDGSGARSVDDIFVFLNIWFAGCP